MSRSRASALVWVLVLEVAGPAWAADPHQSFYELVTGNGYAVLGVDVSEGQAKLDAYAAATALCQPSVNESFSIVIMESWLAGAPVLVHRDCEVTHYHVLRSRGGLAFRTDYEFAESLDLLLQDDIRRRLGENGRAYVQSQYAWSQVLERFQAALDAWDALRTM